MCPGIDVIKDSEISGTRLSFFFNIFKKLSDNIINSNILDGLIYTASIYIVVFNVFSTNSVYIDVKLT